MKGLFPPRYTFETSDWNVDISIPFSESLVIDNPIFSNSNIPNMYSDPRKPKGMYSTVPHSGDYSRPSQTQHMGGLTKFPTNARSNSHMPSVQKMNFMDGQPDPRSFLTPGNYSTGRRGSTGADTVDSHYAWSTASNADILSTSPNVSSFDTPIGPEVSTSFMQGYYSSESLQQTINDSRISGYTPQQIDKWCIDSNPAEDFYQSQSYANMSSMGFSSSVEMQSELYPTINNNLHPGNEQWLSCPPQSAPDRIPESFFSIPQPVSAPRSVPAPSSHPYQYTAATYSVSSSPPQSYSDPDSPPPAPGGSGSGSGSGSNASDLSNYGIPMGDGTWRCAHPGCSSQALFRRGCDLRKHFNRHRKYLFCRYEGCPQSAQNAQSVQNGFSSKKDRDRHEAKHNPGVFCEWEGCGKVFSRVDNMKDHVRRIHRKGEAGST